MSAAARLRAGDDPGDVAAMLEKNAQDADLDFVAAEVPTALSQSQEGVERVATIVRAMKAFGRPDPTDPEPTDIDGLVDNAMTVAGNELKYVAEVTTDLGAHQTVVCFPGAISQVLLNLLVNAAYAVGESQRRDGPTGTDQRKDLGRGGPGAHRCERHRAGHRARCPASHIPALLHH